MIAYLNGRIVEPLRQQRVLLMVCTATVIIMLGQGVITPVLPIFAESFGVGAAMVGLTVSVFGLARLFVNLPAGYVSERFGRRVLLIGGPIIVALGSLFSVGAVSFWQLILSRLIAGAGSAMFMTGAQVLLADVSNDHNRGRLMSLQQGSLLLGASFGPALGGFTAALWGFRAPFVVMAALSAVAAVWAFLQVQETRSQQAAAPMAASDKRAAMVAAPALKPRPGIATILFDINFLLVGMVTLAVFLTRTGSRQTLLPLVGHNRLDMDTGTLGVIFTIMGLLNMLMLLPAGSLIDRLGRKVVIVPSTLLTGIAIAICATSDNVWLFVGGTIVWGIATGLAGPAPAAYAADLAPPHMRGITMGLYRTFGDLGFFIGPVLLGWFADLGGYGWGLGANAIMLIAFALLFGIRARETLMRQSPQTALARPARVNGLWQRVGRFTSRRAD